MAASHLLAGQLKILPIGDLLDQGQDSVGTTAVLSELLSIFQSAYIFPKALTLNAPDDQHLCL